MDFGDAEQGRGRPDRRTVYVLGSGPSLLELGAAERAHVARQVSVGMNKYLLFWEMAGIFPSHFFLADVHYPAVRVYEESVAAARSSGRAVHFLLDASYGARYGGAGRGGCGISGGRCPCVGGMVSFARLRACRRKRPIFGVGMGGMIRRCGRVRWESGCSSIGAA